jgi:hypothetical protein
MLMSTKALDHECHREPTALYVLVLVEFWSSGKPEILALGGKWRLRIVFDAEFCLFILQCEVKPTLVILSYQVLNINDQRNYLME